MFITQNLVCLVLNVCTSQYSLSKNDYNFVFIMYYVFLLRITIEHKKKDFLSISVSFLQERKKVLLSNFTQLLLSKIVVTHKYVGHFFLLHRSFSCDFYFIFCFFASNRYLVRFYTCCVYKHTFIAFAYEFYKFYVFRLYVHFSCCCFVLFRIASIKK